MWFLTSDHTPKVDEIEAASRVNVSYADPARQTFVSVSGNAQSLHDPNKVRELWSDGAQRWFPQGPDDPKITILKVQIDQAEYWDTDTRAMKNLMDRGASAEEIVRATDHKKLD